MIAGKKRLDVNCFVPVVSVNEIECPNMEIFGLRRSKSVDTDEPEKHGQIVCSDRQHEELQQSTWIMQKWCWHNLICLYWHIQSQLQTSWLILVLEAAKCWFSKIVIRIQWSYRIKSHRCLRRSHCPFFSALYRSPWNLSKTGSEF